MKIEIHRTEVLEWPQRAPDFQLLVPEAGGASPGEPASIWLSWSEEGLHLAARLTDSEVVGGLDRDEVLHFRHGDVLELFLKPRAASHYWEHYATPLGRKSTLFFRAPRGTSQPDPLTEHPYRGVRVVSRIVPDGWETEMRIPAKELTALGDPWHAGAEWTFLVGRYNHRADLQSPELSTFPSLSRADFHATAEYASLCLR